LLRYLDGGMSFWGKVTPNQGFGVFTDQITVKKPITQTNPKTHRV
jgi:hypothetical protein